MPKKKSDKKLLKELIDKGYGEDERKKRLELYKKRIQGKHANRQNQASPGYKQLTKDTRTEQAGMTCSPAFGSDKNVARGKNKTLDPKLRRRIDNYAYKNGCAVTGGKERIISLLTVINPFLKDFVSPHFIKLLLLGKGYKEETPYQFCLLDNMEALFYGARFILGYDRPAHNLEERKACEEKVKVLEGHFKNRLPLVLVFLKRF
jgi:hypothetical protein